MITFDHGISKIQKITASLIFVTAIVVSVIVFPDQREFRFEYQKGKMWQHDDLVAPFDFVVLKSSAELKNERDSADALAAYQRATVLKPDDPAIVTNMGVILGKLGKTAESQEAFKKAASMNPGAASQNYYNLGATLVNNGKVAEAAEAFKQAIAADPNFAEAYYQLGMCESGNDATIPDAIKNLQKYIQIGKNTDQIEVAKQIIQALSAKK